MAVIPLSSLCFAGKAAVGRREVSVVTKVEQFLAQTFKNAQFDGKGTGVMSHGTKKGNSLTEEFSECVFFKEPVESRIFVRGRQDEQVTPLSVNSWLGHWTRIRSAGSRTHEPCRTRS